MVCIYLFNQMSLIKKVKVLVVGSGLTGCAAAAMIKQKYPNADITIWEKARRLGGRMTTSLGRFGPAAGKCTADLGAKYFIVTDRYMFNRENFYSELQAQGILMPLKGEIIGINKFTEEGNHHFVTPHGGGSLIKHFLQKAKPRVEYSRHVTKVELGVEEETLKVIDTRGNNESFHAVVLTIPVPQILDLKGIVPRELEICCQKATLEDLCDVTYSSCFALGLFFLPGTVLPYQWGARYYDYHDSHCIYFIANDSQLRGFDANAVGPSVVVQTNTKFGLQHLEEKRKVVKYIIMNEVMQCLPDLPDPIEVQCEKWRYAYVHQSYPGKPGCVTLKTRPLIVLGGDGFSVSSFDGCIDSAEAISKTVTDYFLVSD